MVGGEEGEQGGGVHESLLGEGSDEFPLVGEDAVAFHVV